MLLSAAPPSIPVPLLILFAVSTLANFWFSFPAVCQAQQGVAGGSCCPLGVGSRQQSGPGSPSPKPARSTASLQPVFLHSPKSTFLSFFFFPHTGQQNTAGLGVPVAGSTLVTPAHQKWGGSASPEPCPRENADIWHFSGAMGLVAKGFLPQWLNLCRTQRCRAFGPPDVVFVL